MWKLTALAFCSLAVLTAQPAQAQAVVTLNTINSFDDNNLTRSGTGPTASVEVGDVTEFPDPDMIGDRHSLTGVIEINALYDFDPETIGALYLTFDIAGEGGSYPPLEGPGNIGQSFDGDIQLSWFNLNFPGAFSFATTPITSFSVSSTTTLAGSTLSLRIDPTLDGILNGQYGANRDVGFKLSADAPMNTAWTFNAFRLTRSDQTHLIGAPTSATPEPGVWALLIMGFGGVGSALRRSRRQVAV